MVLWLHQCILYIKTKLREWRAQKCNRCFGAKSPLRCTGQQNSRFHAAPSRAYSADFPKLGGSFNHGTVITPMHSLYQNEPTGMDSQKCNRCFGAKSPLCSTGLQNTQFHAAANRADSPNFPKFGSSFNHGTVFAPMHSLYQKEATGIESPKM